MKEIVLKLKVHHVEEAPRRDDKDKTPCVSINRLSYGDGHLL